MELTMSENDDISLDAPRFNRDQDGVASLRDTDEEQGDDEELDDLFDVDESEAREADADLDGDASDEPRLD
jgi:hypothetical protein